MEPHRFVAEDEAGLHGILAAHDVHVRPARGELWITGVTRQRVSGLRGTARLSAENPAIRPLGGRRPRFPSQLPGPATARIVLKTRPEAL